MKRLWIVFAVAGLVACNRFGNPATSGAGGERIVVIAQAYTDILWALGAQEHVVAVDFSSTYPPEVKKLPTVGYHRALSAEGILSLKPTLVLHDNNIGPPQVVDQLQSLGIPMKSFAAKNDSIEGTEALIREMGAFFHQETRAEELCEKLDADMTRAQAEVRRYTDHPRVVVIHFGRASNVYLLVGARGEGDAGAAGRMVEWAGGEMAVTSQGMQRLTSPEVVAQANPDVVLMTDFGYDRLDGSMEKISALPGVATSAAARDHRVYRVEEHRLMYLGPQTGENVLALAKLLHRAP